MKSLPRLNQCVCVYL